MKRKLIIQLLSTMAILGLPLIFLGNSAGPAPYKLKWEQLFDGKDLKGWSVKIRNHDLNDNYNNTFRVENGNLSVRYDQYTNFDELYGHIFYNKPFSYYLIGVEYRFVGEQVKGGPGWAWRNNGVMIHGQTAESMGKNQDYPASIEVQLLGGRPEGPRPTANVCTPGTQYVRNGQVIRDHCVESSSKTYRGDQWVRVEALVLGDSLIVHYVNGEEVMRYTRPQLDPVGDAKEGKLLSSGTISLQSESHPCDFRKVEVINLEKYAKDPKKLKTVIDQLMSEKRVAAN